MAAAAAAASAAAAAAAPAEVFWLGGRSKRFWTIWMFRAFDAFLERFGAFMDVLDIF